MGGERAEGCHFVFACVYFFCSEEEGKVRVIRVSHRASVNSLLSRVSF